jgi:hypothetical protein
MPRAPALPNDLVHAILQLCHLRDDSSTLRACACVHSSWTLSAQQHLFYRVVLTRASRQRRLAKVINGKPALGSLIQEAVASCAIGIEPELIDIASHLRQVHTLGCEMSSSWESQYVRIQSFIDLLPELKSLHVRPSWRRNNTTMQPEIDHPRTTSLRSMALRDLIIEDNVGMVLTSWLNHVLDTSSLTSLSCYCRGGDTTSPDTRHILDMLQRCPNLRSMHIDASKNGWDNFKHDSLREHFLMKVLGRALMPSFCRPHGLGARRARGLHSFILGPPLRHPVRLRPAQLREPTKSSALRRAAAEGLVDDDVRSVGGFGELHGCSHALAASQHRHVGAAVCAARTRRGCF